MKSIIIPFGKQRNDHGVCFWSWNIESIVLSDTLEVGVNSEVRGGMSSEICPYAGGSVEVPLGLTILTDISIE